MTLESSTTETDRTQDKPPYLREGVIQWTSNASPRRARNNKRQWAQPARTRRPFTRSRQKKTAVSEIAKEASIQHMEASAHDSRHERRPKVKF